MTTKIIYHDFRNSNTQLTPATTVYLTARHLAKARRWASLNQGLNVACITLCGACIALSIFIFGAIFGSM